MPPECLFCRIVSGELPSSQVYSDEHVVAIRDIAPQAPVHVLLLSRRHVGSINELTAEDGDLVGQLCAVAREIAGNEGVAESGYRLVVNVGRNGGQTVDHLHVHLLGGRQMHWPPG